MNIRSILKRRSLWLTLLAALLFGVLAYQFRPTYTIPVGSWYDRVAIRNGWWGDELADGQRYRWTSGKAEVEFVNFGTLITGDYELGLKAQFYNQVPPPPAITLAINGHIIYPEPGSNSQEGWYFRISEADVKAADSPLRIVINVPTFTVAGDSRNLGIKVTEISLYDAANNNFSLALPPLAPLLYLLLLALFAYLTFARQRLLGAVAAFIAIASAAYSLLVNLALSVWLLPAATILLLALALFAWRDELFGWYPGWLARVRGLADDGWVSQRIVKTDKRIVESEPGKPLSQRERLGEGEARPTSISQENITPTQNVTNHAPTDVIHNSQFNIHNSSLLTPHSSLLILAVVIYAAFALWLISQVDFIGHADYADNAVVARNIVRGAGATTDYVAQFYRQYPNVQHSADTWPLLQPLMTMPFLAISDSTFAAKLPNFILMLVLVASVYHVGRKIWDVRVGLLAAIFTLLYPYLLNMVVYPVNDLVFSLLFLWLVYIVVTRRLSDAGSWRAWAAWGALAGLLIWAKPSGATLLLPLFVYALAALTPTLSPGGERGRIGRQTLISCLLIAAIGLIVISPLLIRNISAFSTPFYSTESYDAWVTKWNPPPERIYAYYSPSDLPNRSWLLRYGFDAIYRGVGREVQALWGGNSPTGGGTGLFGGVSSFFNGIDHDAGIIFADGDIGNSVAVAVAILALFVAPKGWSGQRIRFKGETEGVSASEPTIHNSQFTIHNSSVAPPLLLSLVVYAAFITIYWHYEPRYFQVYAIWVCLLAAAAILWLYDALAKPPLPPPQRKVGAKPPLPPQRGRVGVGAIVATILAAAVLIPSLISIANAAPIYAGATPLVEAAQWFGANTPAGTVVMSRNPWEFSWHSDRLGVMIPLDPQNINSSLPQIKAAAQQYHASYIMLDHLGPPGATYFRSDWRRDIAPMYNQRTACRGFTLVYQNKSVVIYKMDVAAIGNACNAGH